MAQVPDSESEEEEAEVAEETPDLANPNLLVRPAFVSKKEKEKEREKKGRKGREAGKAFGARKVVQHSIGEEVPSPTDSTLTPNPNLSP